MIQIGYFQYLPKFLDVQENLNEVKKLLKQNKSTIDTLDLLIFPEYFLSGPLTLDFIPEYEKKMSSKQIKVLLSQISQNYPKATFIMGSVLLKQEGRYFNTSLAVKNGKILAEYHKKALIYNENYICQSDNKQAVFKVKDIRVGLAICWDIILPEVFRKYVGIIDLMILPSFWGVAGNVLQLKYHFLLEKKYYDALGIARAYENAYAFLFINAVGKYRSPFYSDRLMGSSYFVVPPLGLIHKTNDKDPSRLHTICYNSKPLNQFREFYATDKDYFYYLSKKVI